MSISTKLKGKIKKENTLFIGVDKSCEMATVELNGNIILCGNFWDFHPGCHGHSFDFKGYDDLAEQIQEYIESKNKSVDINHDTQWKYEKSRKRPSASFLMFS